MWSKGLIRACCLGLISVLFASGAVAAPPPRPDPGDSAGTRNKKIEARIKYWLEQIRTAKDAKTIDEGRRGLIGDYSQAAAGRYASSFSLRMVKPATTFLTGQIEPTDPLKRLKEVNTALAISRMSQKEIQPVLEVMVKHSNPAVRYSGWGSYNANSGWGGYNAIRNQVLEDPDLTKIMLKSLDKAGGETSLAVMALVHKMLYFPLVRPASIAAKTWRQGQETAYAIFDRVWRTRCWQVLQGDTEMGYVCGKALPALVRLDAALGKDNEKKRQRVRQMIANLTWCAGQAYDKALQAEKAAEAAAKAAGAGAHRPAVPGTPPAGVPATRPGTPATMPAGAAARLAEAERTARQQAKAHKQDAASMAMLLRICEKNLNALERIGRRHTYIQDALTDRRIVDRGTSVREAVIKWIEDHLDKDRVVIPRRKVFEPKPTTRAATATAPAK